MKYQEFTGKLTSVERLNCSVNGNPAFRATFTAVNGETLTGRTTPDAACVYGFLNKRDAVRNIRYHLTPSGAVRFDYCDVLPDGERTRSHCILSPAEWDALRPVFHSCGIRPAVSGCGEDLYLDMTLTAWEHDRVDAILAEYF